MRRVTREVSDRCEAGSSPFLFRDGLLLPHTLSLRWVSFCPPTPALLWVRSASPPHHRACT